MLIFYNFLAAAIVALIFFGILYLVLKLGEKYGPGAGCAGLIFIYLLLFLPTWAGGLWLRPIGPAFGGVRILNLC